VEFLTEYWFRTECKSTGRAPIRQNKGRHWPKAHHTLFFSLQSFYFQWVPRKTIRNSVSAERW
ncbi:hypothetical protein NDU88_001079, partial [Pleurodeles waltl]